MKQTSDDPWETSIDASGFRVLTCRSCPYKTSILCNMRLHFNAKHSPNPVTFGCPHCPYRAKQKGHLKTHIILRHTPSGI
jgi:hypothetical protein